MTHTRPAKPTATPGYFTPLRIERLFRYTAHHWGLSWMQGRDGLSCPCCGAQVLAPPPTTAPGEKPQPRTTGLEQALCDALTTHLRNDCPHADDAPDLLGERPEAP